jgi:hypothetical protein
MSVSRTAQGAWIQIKVKTCGFGGCMNAKIDGWMG